MLIHTAQEISLDDVTKGTDTCPSGGTPPTASCGLCPLRPPCFCLLSCVWKVNSVNSVNSGLIVLLPGDVQRALGECFTLDCSVGILDEIITM